jgi:hypothetical protein
MKAPPSLSPPIVSSSSNSTSPSSSSDKEKEKPEEDEPKKPLPNKLNRENLGNLNFLLQKGPPTLKKGDAQIMNEDRKKEDREKEKEKEKEIDREIEREREREREKEEIEREDKGSISHHSRAKLVRKKRAPTLSTSSLSLSPNDSSLSTSSLSTASLSTSSLSDPSLSTPLTNELVQKFQALSHSFSPISPQPIKLESLQTPMDESNKQSNTSHITHSSSLEKPSPSPSDSPFSSISSFSSLSSPDNHPTNISSSPSNLSSSYSNINTPNIDSNPSSPNIATSNATLNIDSDTDIVDDSSFNPDRIHEYFALMSRGIIANKHSSNTSKSHTKFIFINPKYQLFYNENSNKNAEKYKENPKNMLNLSLFLIPKIQILKGKTTPVFLNSSNNSNIDSDCCLSILNAKERQLDLEFKTKKDRDDWYEILTFVLKQAQEEREKALLY